MQITFSEKDKTILRQIWEALWRWSFGIALGMFIGLEYGRNIWRD